MIASLLDKSAYNYNNIVAESPLVETSPKVSDLRHSPLHKTAWLSEEGLQGAGTKGITPQRYLSKKDTDGRAGQCSNTIIILFCCDRMSLITTCLLVKNLDSMHKRLSMDPSARVKLAKLEWVSYNYNIVMIYYCYIIIDTIHYFSRRP